jgi:hypothetical protein
VSSASPFTLDILLLNISKLSIHPQLLIIVAYSMLTMANQAQKS